MNYICYLINGCKKVKEKFGKTRHIKSIFYVDKKM